MGSGPLPAACDCFVEYVVGSVELSVGGFSSTYLLKRPDGIGMMNVGSAVSGYEGARVYEESQRFRESSSP